MYKIIPENNLRRCIEMPCRCSLFVLSDTPYSCLGATYNNPPMSHQNPTTEPNISPFTHGSDCVRADFHLHTKADKEFKYTCAYRKLSPSILVMQSTQNRTG